MTSIENDKKTTGPNRKNIDPVKSHVEIPAKIEEAKGRDKSVYGSDPETERDILGTQPLPGKDKNLPTGVEQLPGSGEREPSKKVA